MNAPGPSASGPFSGKNLIIILLVAIVAVQGYFLLRGPGNAPPQIQGGTAPGEASQAGKAEGRPSATAGPTTAAPGSPDTGPTGKAQAPRIVSFTLDERTRNAVYFGFNTPMGEGREGPLTEAPFDVQPAPKGEWLWLGPYVLRFQLADKAKFDPSVHYVFTARPERLLQGGAAFTGQTAFTVKPLSMRVREVRTELEPVAGKQGMVVVKGRVTFSRNVDDKAIVKAMVLKDPRLGLGGSIPLAVSDDEYRSSENSVAFVSEPVPAEVKGRTLTLMLDKEKAASSDGAGLDQSMVQAVEVRFDPVLALSKLSTRGEANTEVVLDFSAKVDPVLVKRNLRIEPPVDVTLSEDYGGLAMTGDFKAGTTYTVILQKGLTARNGATMPEEVRQSLTLPDRDPVVGFAHQGMFLPRSGSKSLDLKSVNLRDADVRIERVYRNNIFFCLNYYQDSIFQGGYQEPVLPYLGDQIADFPVRMKTPKNQEQLTAINVGEKVKDFEPGMYRVAASAKGQEYGGESRWLLITDLGIVAKRGHDDLLVWVSSFKDLSPVAGARVKVITTKNQVLVQGVTDAKGVWRAAGLANLPEEREPFIITVEKDADYSFLHFERFRTDMTGLDVSGVEVAQAGYQAFLWGERDLYRPGETVTGVVAVRDASLKTPPPMPLKLRWTDPQGRELAVETAKTDAQGVATFSRAFPVAAITGSYELECLAGDQQIGLYRFQLEDFQPDRIATAVTPDVERAAPGQDLAFTVLGKYLFGAPAAGLDVEAQATLTAAEFAPKGLEAYVFGNPERAFEPLQMVTETGKLDEDGKARFTAAIPAGLKPGAALSAVITARVSESGGRGVAARIKIPVHAYPAYPGLKKLGESGLAPGQPQSFDYIVVNPDGKPATVSTLVAELYEDRWQTVLRRQTEGTGYKYETKRDSRLVERRELASPGEKGTVTLTPPKFGSYRLALTDPATGASVQMSFWCQGGGYNPWAMENPAKLEIVSAKTDYLPGETASLQVRAPFAGKLLLTVESTAVRDYMVVDMPANTAEVAVPIKPGYSPNVYITGVVVRKGTDVLANQAGRAFGTLSLNVAREAGRQTPVILAPEQIRPLTKLTLTVKADPNSVVTIAAVDEGILQLVAQKTPDPWALFYAKRRLEVNSYDIYSLLLPELHPLGKKAPAGGDQDLGRFLRTESPQAGKPVAFWSGPLKADAQGRVQYTVDVPRFQGALRVMAVAAAGNRFGSAQQFTRVRSPLVVMPTFPRFAQLGETLRLPVALRNDTGADGQFQLALKATGPVQPADSTQTLAVPVGKERAARFAISTGQTEGVATLAVTATGNNETSDADTSFLVRSPLPAVSRLAAGAVEGPSLEFPALSQSGFLPGSARRSLRLGRFPMVRFEGKLEALLGYPFGCVEQTTSKAFPLLYFAELAKELEPAALEKSSPQAMVQSGITRLLSMQLPSGGFSMWMGGQDEQPWGTVYATHFLLEAGRAGYQVPPAVLTQALEAVGGQAKTLRKDAFKTQAYALYVLAKACKPDKGTMDHLRDKQATGMSSDAKAMLAAAYAATGNAKGGDKLLQNLGEPAAAPRDGDIFDSKLRSQALLLAALADIAPDDARTAEAARTLARMLETTSVASTQESGMAFMAMGKLFARQQALPVCTGKVMAGSAVLAAFDTSKTLTLKNIKDQGPLRLELDPGCKPGSVYYSLDTRGIPELAAYKPEASGLEIKREFLDRDGKTLDVSKLVQGLVVVVRTSVRSTSGPVKHVAVSQLLPTGLEVENPRLATTDKLPWMEEPAATSSADYRADRVNVFLDLDNDKWQDIYTLARAVIPGNYVLPPAQVEAMYYPELKANTALGTLAVEEKE